MAKIGIIVPCYNQIEYTKKFVQSVIDNSTQPYQFIFIDNASTDGTYNYLQSVPNSIVIHNEENRFVNPAWNQGFKHLLYTDCDYACLINNDIVVGKKWLDPIFDAFSKRNNEYYIPASNHWNNHTLNVFNNYQDFESYTYPDEIVPVNCLFMGFCIFMKREHIEVFYPIPEGLKIIMGDDYIEWMLAVKGISPYMVKKCALYHFYNKTQVIVGNGHDIRGNDSNFWNSDVKQHIIKSYIKYRKAMNPNWKSSFTNSFGENIINIKFA